MEDGIPIENSLFVYAPNQIAPVIFAVSFAASGGCHAWLCYRYKCWKLMILHPQCALLFAAGFALREYGAFHYLFFSLDDMATLIIFILSQCFIYVAPPLLELANYHILGRIFFYVPYLSPLDPGHVLSIFGLLSLIVEGLNAIGIAFRSNANATESIQNLGRILTIAALVLQLVIILCFVFLAALFHRRCVRAGLLVKTIAYPLITLYTSTALILTRCIYRTVEQSGTTTVHTGGDLMTLSPILRYEWYFYVFEATLMLCNSLLWLAMHPRRWLPANPRVYIARDGKTEIEASIKKKSFPLLALLTFGVVGREKRGSGEDFLQLDDRSTSARGWGFGV